MKPKAPCALCDTCTLRNEPFVPSEFPESDTAEYGFIGWAPGREEVKQGRPLVGPSGKLYNGMLEHVSLLREDVYISNAVLCACPRNREPTPEEVMCCAPRLEKEMSDVGASKIMTLGKVPRDLLLPELSGESMMSVRGKWYRRDGLDIFPIYHPAYVLHGQPLAYHLMLLDTEKFVKYPLESWHFREPDYLVLENFVQLKRAVRAALAANVPICVDAETSNLDKERTAPELWWEGMILCLGFHWEPFKAIIVPEELFNSKKGLQIMRPLFENKHGIYGHNVKYDMNYIKMYYNTIGKSLKRAFISDDSFIMHSLLTEIKGIHSLKECSTYYFNAPDWEKEIHKYLRYPKRDSYAKVPRDVLHKYLAYDVHYGVLLREHLEKLLRDSRQGEMPYRAFLVDSLNLLQRAEETGMPVSFEKLDRNKRIMAAKVDQLRDDLRDISGKQDLNPNAPKQCAVVIYDDLGFSRHSKKGKVGARSTNAEVLNFHKGKHPFIDTLRTYRRWGKLYSTYAKKIPDRVDKNGFAHYQFNLAGTETGRISGELLLTIPRKYTPEGKMIREAFEAPEGFKIVGADFSQAELRWGAWYSQDDFLRSVYEADGDLHTQAAIEVYGPDFTREDRMHTKMLNFSFMYGGNEYSFAVDSGIPLNEARAVVVRYKKMMPKLNAWREGTWAQVKRDGFLQTPLRRVRRYPLLTHQNIRAINNEAVNFRVQSISSDCTLWGFVKTANHFRKKGADVWPILFMHDGAYLLVKDDDTLIAEVAYKFRKDLIWTANHIMKNAGKWVPEYAGLDPVLFKVDLEVGKSWGGLEDYDV